MTIFRAKCKPYRWFLNLSNPGLTFKQTKPQLPLLCALITHTPHLPLSPNLVLTTRQMLFGVIFCCIKCRNLVICKMYTIDEFMKLVFLVHVYGGVVFDFVKNWNKIVLSLRRLIPRHPSISSAMEYPFASHCSSSLFIF